MTKRDGTQWAPLKLYESAQRTLKAFDTLLAQAPASVTPSAAVTACRDDLADIALEEAQTLTEIHDVKDQLAGSAEHAAHVLAREDTPADDRLAALARVLGSTSPDIARTTRKMSNQARFRHARRAAQRWHALGDELLTGLLAPWAEAIITELEDLAGHVLEGRHEAMVEAEAFAIEYDIKTEDVANWQLMPERYHGHYKRLRAAELAHQYRHLAEIIVELELRARGLLPDLHPDSNVPRSALIFADPTQLPSVETLDSRATLWLVDAIANGARPRLATATEVAKTYKIPETAMATT
ncbi:hypothetical protein QBL07_018005 [Gordonia rubripertincta]|uniref:DUF222 domain-containing protein n=1 Tax=Gordonia rubripertincta TaxID=36822 RepID=A0AAW6R5G9_GORRU|nr:hypothetical protein [Gordonia rubripertincta]MDG6779575.1 hypothetical protein [Gordonia rubripertincta]NKY62881.1 hypothetical protein [Gordonia rubripertincta]